MHQRTRSVLFILLFVISIIGSYQIGFKNGKSAPRSIDSVVSLKNKEIPAGLSQADFSAFWDVWNILNDKYVPSKGRTLSTTTDQTRVWGAIAGMTASLGDPYTVFFPPVESKNFASVVKGELEGVGMEVGMKDGIPTVIAPLKDTPAFKAGVKPGDKIAKVDGKSTEKLSIEDVINLIRGPKGTQVTISVLHTGGSKLVDITMTRDIINVPTLQTEKRKDGIFVIHLFSFTETSPGLFKNAIAEAAKNNADKIIIDLRGNPGGYLEAAVDMASYFLPEGDVVVSENYNKQGDNMTYKSKGYNVFTKKPKVVILIDGGSASASEIFAGALQEHKAAKLLGQKSFGKGSVQELVNITSDTSLKVTVARWFTPNGVSISGEGLTPDVTVAQSEADTKKLVDTQMEAAASLLLKE